MTPSYEQNIAKSCEIHGTVNFPFKWLVHEEYKGVPALKGSAASGSSAGRGGSSRVPTRVPAQKGVRAGVPAGVSPAFYHVHSVFLKAIVDV